MFSFRQKLNNKSFTLIELLIVIAILALLMSIIILTLNPAEMLKKTRDTKRISNLKSINNALGIFQATRPTASIGTANIVYISIPDSSSTCANLGLPVLPGYTYQCSTTANYKKTDGTGWIPVNFNNLDIGSPISSLPIDPTNTTSTGLYFTYVIGGSWELRALMESTDQDQAISDGDTYPGLYSVGSTLNLTPGSRDRGLVGYWDFEEGTGATVYDRSPYQNNGTWSGSGTHYTIGKVGNYAGNFSSTTVDYVNVGSNTILYPTELTFIAWAKAGVIDTYRGIMTNKKTANYGINLQIGTSNKIASLISNGSSCVYVLTNWAPTTDIWYHIVATYKNSDTSLYVNGQYENHSTLKTLAYSSPISNVGIGCFYLSGTTCTLPWHGQIDDVRVYNRALSADEIKIIYEGTK
jgi:prepilin-type N-terminal cleavage/methylation domain-containing protein